MYPNINSDDLNKIKDNLKKTNHDLDHDSDNNDEWSNDDSLWSNNYHQNNFFQNNFYHSNYHQYRQNNYPGYQNNYPYQNSLVNNKPDPLRNSKLADEKYKKRMIEMMYAAFISDKDPYLIYDKYHNDLMSQFYNIFLKIKDKRYGKYYYFNTEIAEFKRLTENYSIPRPMAILTPNKNYSYYCYDCTEIIGTDDMGYGEGLFKQKIYFCLKCYQERYNKGQETPINIELTCKDNDEMLLYEIEYEKNWIDHNLRK